jgi:hypothetical protein
VQLRIASIFGACSARLYLIVLIAGACEIAVAQPKPSDEAGPVIGGVASLPDAMLVYHARGAAGACGEGCSEWLAAEGTVHWDGHKRMLAALDRFADRKRPFIFNVRGSSDFGVASSIGRILRERAIEVTAAETVVDQCGAISHSECTALKRADRAAEASVRSIGTCDIACVLILAGGVRRTLPETTAVIIQGSQITSRLGLNVSPERREGLRERFNRQFRLYFSQMGVDPQLADIIDVNHESSRSTELSRADLLRLRIITSR